MSTVAPDLAHEELRLMTFDADWPHPFISPRILAKIGFYYTGPYDQVKCHFCKVNVRSWEIGDNEVNEHKRWSPQCPLLERCETANVPLKPTSELDKLLPPRSAAAFDECGSTNQSAYFDRRPGSYTETHFPTPNNAQMIDIAQALASMSADDTEPYEFQAVRHGPEFPEYAIEMARLRSFAEWPKTMKQKPEQLSDAGFFYTQTGDRVLCFHCGGGLREWETDDLPWEQHVLWYEQCDYLRLIKGPDYIAAVKEKFAKIHSGKSNAIESTSTSSQEESIGSSTAPSSDDDHQNADDELNETRMCKICYACEYNTAFFPCGHVIACAKCALSQTKCPMCRKPFECVMRIFLS